jgi:hypothetical protein
VTVLAMAIPCHILDVIKKKLIASVCALHLHVGLVSICHWTRFSHSHRRFPGL